MTSALEALGHLVQLVEVLPDDEGRLAGMPLGELLDDRQLGVGARREAVTLLGLAHGIREALALGQRDAHLDAVGGSDVALGLDVLPRRVEALGADEAEDVGLATVLAHERRGEPEPPAGLQVGGHAEDRGRQQVHLVVDDEAPVAGVEQVEVGVDALPLGRQHLVGRDGDGADLLALRRSTRRSPPR